MSDKDELRKVLEHLKKAVSILEEFLKDKEIVLKEEKKKDTLIFLRLKDLKVLAQDQDAAMPVLWI